MVKDIIKVEPYIFAGSVNSEPTTVLMNVASCRTLFMVVAFGMICGFGYAQKSNLASTDSLQFEELAKQFNNLVNNEPARADSFASLYVAKAEQLNNEDYMGRGATLKATAGMQLKRTEEAETWYTKAQAHFTKAENFLWKGYGNLNMGIVFSQKYDFEKSLTYLYKAVNDFEKAADYDMVVTAYNNISNVFHNSKNYEKGKEYAGQSLRIISEHPEVKSAYRWYAYNVLAINYDDNREYSKAIATHLKALPYAATRIGSTYNNLGNSYKKLGKADSALHYFQLSLMSLQTNPPTTSLSYSYATTFGNLADVTRMNKDYSVANNYLDSALYYAEKSESPEKLMDAYEYAWLLKKETGDYKPAMEFLEKYGQLKDSLLNIEKTGTLLSIQEKYEAEKKQKIIEQQKFEIAKKDQWLWLGGSALLFLGIAGYFFYKNSKNKQERKLQQQVFNRQEIESRALFEGEQNERIRIARDLHDGVGQMLSLVKMNLSAVDAGGPMLEKAMALTDKTIDEVRNVSHNLIPQELNFGIFKALNNLADKVSVPGGTKMNIDIPEELQSLQFEKQNELSIYRIVQEVVNNMVKHAGASLINLSIFSSGEHIIISVKDNGHGLNVEDIEKSKGIGWKNINARVHMLDGKINVRSERLSGTQIEITLPANGAK
jgi:two-component system, NarL family, sensor kinase